MDAAMFDFAGDELSDREQLVSSCRLHPDGVPLRSPWLEDESTGCWILSADADPLGVPIEIADLVLA